MSLKSEIEELANIITHGFGLVLSSIAFVNLLVLSIVFGDIISVICCFIYGLSLVLMYGSSTLYHSAKKPEMKSDLQLLDHISIYFLIAGTYTPFTKELNYPWGLLLLISVWVLSICGIYYKLKSSYRFSIYAAIPYLFLGWLVILFIYPIINSLPVNCLGLLFLGGLCYTGGFYFYAQDHKPFFHSIWHIFVLLGSIFHYMVIITIV